MTAIISNIVQRECSVMNLLMIPFFLFSVLIVGQCRGQVPIEDDNGVYINNDPIWAIPFCHDVDMNYLEPLEGWPYCLWFQFDVSDADFVSFSTFGAPAGIISSDEVVSSTVAGEFQCPEGELNFQHNAWLDVGTYFVYFNITNVPQAPAPGPHIRITDIEGIVCPYPDCEGCLASLQLLPNTVYVVSAWVHKEDAPLGTVDYFSLNAACPWIQVEVENAGSPALNVDVPFRPSIDVPIVEGWQLIEGRFTTPAAPQTFTLTLWPGTGTALFDDVRIFPADGSMKSYVYDKTNLRFLAELDERHFATFYEYDAEGKLVRVKKETERGIMTIQETRQNASQLQP